MLVQALLITLTLIPQVGKENYSNIPLLPHLDVGNLSGPTLQNLLFGGPQKNFAENTGSEKSPIPIREEGTIRIDEKKEKIIEDIVVTLKVPEGAAKGYFLNNIGIQHIETLEGKEVPFEEVPLGYPTIIYKLSDIPGGVRDPLKLRIKAEFTLQKNINTNTPGNGWGSFDPEGITFIGEPRSLPSTWNLNSIPTDFWIEAPAGRKITAPGRIVEMQLSQNGWDRYHVVAKSVLFYSVVVGSFEHLETVSSSGKHIELFLKPELFKLVPDLMENAKGIVDFYTSLYGDMRPEQLKIVFIPDLPASGLSYSGFILLEGNLTNVNLDGIVLLMGHEIAHQWFGQTFKIKDEESPWLGEGMATYNALEYLDHAFKDMGFFYRWYYGVLYKQVADSGKDYPLTTDQVNPGAFVAGDYSIVSYYKGAVVTKTLQTIIGEDNFLKAVGLIRKDTEKDEFFAYDLKKFQKYLEKASGKDLAKYFDEWVYKTGYPIYVVGMKKEKQGDKWHVHLDVTASSSNKENSFEMPVDLSFLPDGTSDYITKQVVIKDKKQGFDFDFDSEPEWFLFDPNYTFVKTVKSAVKGDINLDGMVDGIDLMTAVLSDGSSYQTAPIAVERSDLNGDGRVDEKDIKIVDEDWGNVY